MSREFTEIFLQQASAAGSSITELAPSESSPPAVTAKGKGQVGKPWGASPAPSVSVVLSTFVHSPIGRAPLASLNVALPLIGILILLSFVQSPTSASAAQSRTFDPILSLEGACEGKDGVKDPGCPYPPPGEGGPRHLNDVCGVATDPKGYIYVSSGAPGGALEGTEGRIDVFDPAGQYLTEFADTHIPCGLAVDSEGNLFVANVGQKVGDDKRETIARFTPSSYPPTAGTLYGSELIIASSGDACTTPKALAIDPSNDHLYVSRGCNIAEYDSAANGSTLIRSDIGDGIAHSTFGGIDVNAETHDIYVAWGEKLAILDGTDGHLVNEVDGSETPNGDFSFAFGKAGVAVDQENGDVFVVDGKPDANQIVDRFDEEGAFLDSLPIPSTQFSARPFADVAVDGSFSGQLDYSSPNAGYVYVGSGVSEQRSHLWAFKPLPPVMEPAIRNQAVSGVTETEATLKAEVNPNGASTAYHFEYVTQADFDLNGYSDAIDAPIPDKGVGAGTFFTPVSEPISGLSANTAYRFRVVAESIEGTVFGESGEDASFATYPPEGVGLPGRRAYELVTPADTGGRIPTMSEYGLSNSSFNMAMAAPDGESVVFGTEGGSLPGTDASGFHDTYKAVRGEGGWRTQSFGPTGAEAQEPFPGGSSPDQSSGFWEVRNKNGILVSSAGYANYIRRQVGGVPNPLCSPEPAGHFEYTGCGTLGSDPLAKGKWISPGGKHTIVVGESWTAGKSVQLEPCAPASGSTTIYDRTPDGTTHCVSLLPGDGTPAGEVTYLGTSYDGSSVAFKVGSTMYVRRNDNETLTVSEADSVFAGLSKDGSRVFYLQGASSTGPSVVAGELFSCSLDEGSCAGPEPPQSPTAIGSGAKTVPVNVSSSGSHVYFVSPVVLTGGEANDQGVTASVNAENLYVWNDGTVRFIARLDPVDVSGEELSSNGSLVGGLGLWITYAQNPKPGRESGAAADPSRSTPEGSVFVFESHANLTEYQSAGHSEIYRYDADAEAGQQLLCLSCNPTGGAAVSDGQLQVDTGMALNNNAPPANSLAQIANVTETGEEVFFQSADRLVPRDVDGKIDVYGWEVMGNGGCNRGKGCVHLISSGQSASADFLYAMTPDGSNVFFESGDLLTDEDPDPTPSVYDARVDGGFPPLRAAPIECDGEACQPTAETPGATQIATSGSSKPGNPKAGGKSCGKGRRKVRHGGKVRCVKGHQGRHPGNGRSANKGRAQ